MFEKLERMDKVKKILLIIFIYALILAILDILGINLWTEPSGTYFSFFWTNATIFLLALAGVWWMATKDKSESLSILIGGKISTMSGWEDTLFYLIKDRTFDGNNMGHLFLHPIMGTIAKFMGLSTVTITSLFVSLIIGGFITYFGVRYLVRNY